MAGDVVGPRVDLGDVSCVARVGECTWRIDEAGNTWRLTRDDLMAALFDGWELVAPGLVDVNRWRPEHDDVATEPVPGVAGVGFLASKQVATVRRGHDPGS
jgi:hypothetical protein